MSNLFKALTDLVNLKSGLPWIAALASGLLLAFAYPPFECHAMAWWALVPLLLAVEHLPGRRAFAAGFMAGAVHWLITIFWLRHVTSAGMLVLVLYCALYWAFFAAMTAPLFRRVASRFPGANLLIMLLLSLSWAGLEFARYKLFTGFPWNALAVSQFRNPILIRSARWGGVYALSAAITLINLALALTVRDYLRIGRRRIHRVHTELAAAGLLLTAIIWHQRAQLYRAEPPSHSLFVALIQPNFERVEVWDEAYVRFAHETLYTYTQPLAAMDSLDLIVWPETALPDYLRSIQAKASYDLVFRLATNGTPLLVGALDFERGEDRIDFYNTSILFDREARLVEKYDKQHLVVFGEYIPFEKWFPLLKSMTPIDGSFSPGQTGTVFRLPERDIPFSVLICFEDTVASLARNAVRNGARALINQTNDAWFKRSAASLQHLAQSVFRTVETGVPLIRCANTGVSCWIDRDGAIRQVFQVDGDYWIAGSHFVNVAVPGDEWRPTPHMRWGEWFGWLCLAIAVLTLPTTKLLCFRTDHKNEGVP